MAQLVFEAPSIRAWLDGGALWWEKREPHPYSQGETNWQRMPVSIMGIQDVDERFDSFYAKGTEPGTREVWILPKSHLRAPHELVITRLAAMRGGCTYWVWTLYTREPCRLPDAKWIYTVLEDQRDSMAHAFAVWGVLTRKPDAVYPPEVESTL